MSDALASVAGRRYDVIVIGGGINGAGVAREAQLAGYRTLLVERHDFGAGTTSRATRLIHGGLRYLEHGELGLVYESLAERETLVREAAHLVRPLQLLVPVYRGDRRRPWMMRAGLTLYDVLSFRKSMPRHRAMTRRALEWYEPRLNRYGLRAAYTFYDAQVEFPERLAIEAVREMAEAGGVALNHVAAAKLLSPGGMVRGLALRDECSGETAQVETTLVVNAAGPWVDSVLAGSDAERHERLIGGTKGSHLVVEWTDGPRHAIFATARRDGRPFFILPWYGYTLVGTTDLRCDGDPSDARATPDEVAYLLEEATRLFPSAPLQREMVLYTYSGVRPLPYTAGKPEAAITRRHLVVDHVKRGGPSGLLTVVGGKLTTYRSLGRITLKAIRRHLLQPAASETPAPRPTSVRRSRAGLGSAEEASDAQLRDDPLLMYGRRSDEVRDLIDADASLGERICEHHPQMLAQVAYAINRELAVTLADVLLRRLPVGWSRCHALDGAERAARVIGARRGWDEARVAAEVESYERELRRTCVALDDVAAASSG